MDLIVDNMFWIMMISGILTSTMISAVLAPGYAFKSYFGEELPAGSPAFLVVRNWGALIAGVGVLLIVGAFDETIRTWVLIFASFGKALFVGFVFAAGMRYLGHQAFIAASIDLIMVILFVIYLIAA